jgi:hypothetical protein
MMMIGQVATWGPMELTWPTALFRWWQEQQEQVQVVEGVHLGECESEKIKPSLISVA